MPFPSDNSLKLDNAGPKTNPLRPGLAGVERIGLIANCLSGWEGDCT
jgi:hypothetical protein